VALAVRSEFRLLTVAEIAAELRVSESTVRDWCRNGVIKALKAGAVAGPGC
jgi:transposase